MHAHLLTACSFLMAQAGFPVHLFSHERRQRVSCSACGRNSVQLERVTDPAAQHSFLSPRHLDLSLSGMACASVADFIYAYRRPGEALPCADCRAVQCQKVRLFFFFFS